MYICVYMCSPPALLLHLSVFIFGSLLFFSLCVLLSIFFPSEAVLCVAILVRSSMRSNDCLLIRLFFCDGGADKRIPCCCDLFPVILWSDIKTQRSRGRRRTLLRAKKMRNSKRKKKSFFKRDKKTYWGAAKSRNLFFFLLPPMWLHKTTEKDGEMEADRGIYRVYRRMDRKMLGLK